MRNLLFTLILLFNAISCFGQSSVSAILKANRLDINFDGNQFSGLGWERLQSEIEQHSNIMIGEDHFIAEIPLFVSAIASTVHFNNFFCEIDPYSAYLISDQLLNASQEDYALFLQNKAYTFSFYALENEYRLLEKLAKQEADIIGTDQIVLTADALVAQHLKEKTTSDEAKAIYSSIEKESKAQFNLFTSGKGSPYMFTPSFEEKMGQLGQLELSDYEQTLLSDLKLSQKIYATQDHQLRIQLMKYNLMKYSDKLQHEKNLFKYGAIHSSKVESVLGGYDIGNLVAHMADANFSTSLHIMVLAKSGMQGVPFEGMEPQGIDPNSKDLKALAPLFEVTDSEWALFDTLKIRKELKKEQIKLDERLTKMLNGYDYIVVIPEASAAKFLNLDSLN